MPVPGEPAPGPAAGRAELPYRPGERLTYNISWSNLLSAGAATMGVDRERTPEGREILRFTSTARSIGMLDTFYRVDDRVWSLVDAGTLEPISYNLDQRHGKRKKKREITFDHEGRKALYVKDGHRDRAEIPKDVQDPLSSLYYLRSRGAFTTDGPAVVQVHESGKNWSVEVHYLGKERIETPAGSFDTIKLKTYPTYEGVFMHKGEIFIWMTDDARRVPVLMKSTITIGSIVATLVDLRLGEERP